MDAVFEIPLIAEDRIQRSILSRGKFVDGGRGGGFLLRRSTIKIMGRAITAGMPIKTAKISAMTIRSGPMSLAKLARNGVI
jgi:hypothetical protein